MNRIGAVFLIACASACGSSSPDQCDKFSACGGDLTGSWVLTSSCGRSRAGTCSLWASFQASAFDPPCGSASPSMCTGATWTVTDLPTTTLTFGSDGNLSYSITGTGHGKETFPFSCYANNGASCAAIGHSLSSNENNHDETYSCTGTTSCTCSYVESYAAMRDHVPYTTVSSSVLLGAPDGTTFGRNYCVLRGDTLVLAATDANGGLNPTTAAPSNDFMIFVRQ